MRKSIIYALAGLIILFVLLWRSYNGLHKADQVSPNNTNNINQSGITANFICSDSKSVQATFYNQAPSHVSLVLSDGRSLELLQAMSASGARYANTDESFVFWNKGDSAFIEESGTMTFVDCIDSKK
jgi:membrane-bound inhibitor of C-type lysozyme